jgi:hypothetical protein
MGRRSERAYGAALEPGPAGARHGGFVVMRRQRPQRSGGGVSAVYSTVFTVYSAGLAAKSVSLPQLGASAVRNTVNKRRKR